MSLFGIIIAAVGFLFLLRITRFMFRFLIVPLALTLGVFLLVGSGGHLLGQLNSQLHRDPASYARATSYRKMPFRPQTNMTSPPTRDRPEMPPNSPMRPLLTFAASRLRSLATRLRTTVHPQGSHRTSAPP